MKMLAGFVCTEALPNVWSLWIDHVMKQKKRFDFQKASFVYLKNGKTAAASAGFTLAMDEVKSIALAFCDQNNNRDRIRIEGRSYIIKSRTDDTLIAFNGGKYIVVGKSDTMFLVTMCTRQSGAEALNWLEAIRQKLVAKKY